MAFEGEHEDCRRYCPQTTQEVAGAPKGFYVAAATVRPSMLNPSRSVILLKLKPIDGTAIFSRN